RRGMVGVTAASFGGATYGIAFENSQIDVIDVEIPVTGLPATVDGFQIALISDTHSGPFMSRTTMEKVVRMANDLRPDITLVTGDFVNSRLHEVFPFAEAFSGLNAPHGVYGVLGNHDFYTGQVEAVAKEVEECGITLLRDREIAVHHNGGSFSLAGIDDAGSLTSARGRIARAYEENLVAGPRILMSHRPYYLRAAHEARVALMLSGHTHGGQVVLGRFGKTTLAPAAIASGYVWGNYRFESTRLYVNRGIGTVGLPIRLNCAPEITRIILRQSADPDGTA
ncbi:MAG: metallophosphoesterase, partial [Ignavibacteria bacterium]|nr:metallophosphoesterase [Ignavibacteria bacterium]